MNKIKKTILTLVALLALTTGAWAADTYTVTFAANGNTKTVENVTLPKNFQCSYNNADGDLDLILKELYGWTGDSSETICANWSTPKSSDANKVVAGKNGNDHYITIDNVFEGTVTITGDYIVDLELTQYSLEISIAAPASSGPEVAWDKATKTGTFTMPGGNVTLEPEYYPLATLAFQGLTAAEDAAAKTEAPLAVVADGAVTGGTLMYYVATDKNFSQADAIALAETQWSAAIPTAETVEAAGTCYVWYYIKGDAEHSDTDPQRLEVNVLAEPTYTVEFAEGTPESDKWKAEPNADVKKGQTVTVTYTGSKKVLGVKAEKKAKAPATITVTWNNNDITGSGKSFTKDGVTITAGRNIDFDDKNFIKGGTFTTTLGNFTKIEVTTFFFNASGTGWSGSEQSGTWTGTPASSVSFSGDIMGMGEGNTKFVFTIEPTN